MSLRSLWLTLAMIGFVSNPAGAERLCDKAKKGDFRDCVQYLKRALGSGESKRQFMKDFDDICRDNAKFKCTKVTVMGELKDTQKTYEKEGDWKGAEFFQVQVEDGKYLYIFQKK